MSAQHSSPDLGHVIAGVWAGVAIAAIVLAWTTGETTTAIALLATVALVTLARVALDLDDDAGSVLVALLVFPLGTAIAIAIRLATWAAS